MGKKLLVVLVLIVVVAVGGFVGLGMLAGGGDVALAVVSVVRTDFEKGTGDNFVKALDGDTVKRSEVVKTDDKGRGYLTFFDGSTVEIEPGAQVAVAELRSDSDGTSVIQIQQNLGTTWENVTKLANPNSRFEVKTPAVTASVRGTGFHTIVLANGRTTIRVRNGTVVVSNPSGSQTVTAGFESTTDPGQAPPAPTRIPPAIALRISTAPPIDIIVADSRGLVCGGGRAEIPGCGEGSVTVAEPAPGDFSVTLSNSAQFPAAPITLRLEALFGDTLIDSKTAQRTFAPGERARTTFRLGVDAQGRPQVGAPSPFEVVTSTCGVETTGRVFSAGSLSERTRALAQFASTNRGQPAAFVVTQADVLAEAQAAVANQPLSDLAVTLNAAGIRFRATAAVVPVSAQISLGQQDGKLILRVRSLSVPGPVGDQIRPRLEEGLGAFGRGVALDVQRVSLREGCFAIIGLTR